MELEVGKARKAGPWPCYMGGIHPLEDTGLFPRWDWYRLFHWVGQKFCFCNILQKNLNELFDQIFRQRTLLSPPPALQLSRLSKSVVRTELGFEPPWGWLLQK